MALVGSMGTQKAEGASPVLSLPHGLLRGGDASLLTPETTPEHRRHCPCGVHGWGLSANRRSGLCWGCAVEKESSLCRKQTHSDVAAVQRFPPACQGQWQIQLPFHTLQSSTQHRTIGRGMKAPQSETEEHGN